MLFYLVDTDIAFNKSAYASSTHNNDTNNYGPQYVNNEMADCANLSGPIAHTEIELHPWFKIDLEGTFYVKTVVVNPRICKFLLQDILKYSIK